MVVLGIDPNPKESGYVYYSDQERKVLEHGMIGNKELIGKLVHHSNTVVAIERIRSYGQQVGNETIDTVEWCGGFYHVADTCTPGCAMFIPRQEILKMWGIEKKGSDKWLKEYLADTYEHLFPDGVKRNKAGALTVIGWGEHDMSALAVALVAVEWRAMIRKKEDK